MTFSFSNLSLSGVTAATTGGVLPPGRYVCTVRKAEIEDTKDKSGKKLMVLLACSQGVITDSINIYNKSERATEIGLEQLKSLLVNGGHPDPDNIGAHGVGSIKGLVVGVVVGNEKYEGQDRSKVSGYLKPELVTANGQASAKPAAPAAASLFKNSDIPF